MKQIVEYSNWGYWDQLDGKSLKNGERLRLKWPDGTVENVNIVVIDHGITINDMGHTYTGANCQAYVEKLVHGAKSHVAIRGLFAERL